ncbi:ABC transporter ATP-binding protein [Pokkaliibacter sp. MBI-7]|uniref:ABC transporter ATP-binding protein n=1 Tax=Pokkaliibacter sp. MBI-7 TaxID=3040600 RepID=UPI00244827B5|nr:ABC transporter ATP-binding protein [Pokkaliibacter sp. MBI-7]MDH2434199.1 ABC transporter ATP-binding protein [Pokkaliibacter sp. MBI-7]
MGLIKISSLGKAYKVYANRWSRLSEWLSLRKSNKHELHWVIRDVSFDIQPGDAVGVIGINGAGKSTLLKLITGTTQPTEGRVEIKGRVAALLELGMGFHPDFTGRQNCYMSGQLLGYSKQEVEELLPEIEAFAEIGEYMDLPVRVYSSGMQMRLAFSVATAIRPDVLIVDEALSVGDAYFQHKSFEKIRRFSQEGTTLLIVSHDKVAIQSICNRAILLANGGVLMDGQPEAVMDYYNAMLADRQKQQVKQITLDGGRIQTVSGTGGASVTEVRLLDANGKAAEVINSGEKVFIAVTIDTYEYIPRLVFGFSIKDRLGQVVFGTNTHHTQQALCNVAAGSRINLKISVVANIGVGNFSLQTALSGDDTHIAKNYEWRDLALLFTVVNGLYPHFDGPTRLETHIEFESL